MIRNNIHNNREYVIVETFLNIEKGETVISSPIHIRVDISKHSDIDRAIIFGKVNGMFNHTLTIKIKQKATSKKPWWERIFN